MIGDPLYRPFGGCLTERQDQLKKIQSPLREWSQAMLADRALAQHPPAPQVTQQLERLPLTRHSAVLTEKLADILRLEGPATAAMAAYAQALQSHPSPQQKVRVFLALAGLQQQTGSGNQAARTLKQLLSECPEYPARKAIWAQILPLAERSGD